MVEHNLAKVRVASSSLVSRSNPDLVDRSGFFLYSVSIRPGGGTGRRTGLKILRSVMIVRVRFPSRVQKGKMVRESEPFFLWVIRSRNGFHASVAVDLGRGRSRPIFGCSFDLAT